jgi:hypothetical protein
MNIPWLWAAHLALTGYMVGVIWFVQVIHYPWLHEMPVDKFRSYHERYTRTMGWVVGPAMIGEMATGLLLLMQTTGSSTNMLAVSLVLLALIWVSTATLQIPCHHRLSRGYDNKVHRGLVKTNWIRTVGWSLRLVLLLGYAL